MTISSIGAYRECNYRPIGEVLLTGGSETLASVSAIVTAPIIVAWQSSDNDFLRRLSTSTTDISSAIAKSSVSSVTSDHKNALSVGTQAGIGVGVSVTSILIIAVVIGLFWNRLRRSKTKSEPQHDTQQEKAELPGNGVDRQLGDDGILYEAENTSEPPEAAGIPRAELESDWEGWEAPTSPTR